MLLKIGLKYCGGCNPAYDRVATVEKMARRLRQVATFVFPGSDDMDVVLAVQGCGTACADLSPFAGYPVCIISSENEGDRFCEALLENKGRIDHLLRRL